MKRKGYSGLSSFVRKLEQEGELLRIEGFADPLLEISEITDRMVKSGGKALLFTNNGTDFPVLINAFGSDSRMSLAIGRDDLDQAGNEIEELFTRLQGNTGKGLFSKLRSVPQLLNLARLLPVKMNRRGECQQKVMKEPDLELLPILKCWPHDGGRFITLPVVHTYNPFTLTTNAGMYRMQVFDRQTTGMHWHRHKTGANHYSEWKKKGERMPVAVTLGGDPVYTYAATAPLPENIDEYILAGFLRRGRVRLVKCLTQDIWVPEDADFVIEGYVDPSEELLFEGPFGDHTGVYSLADWYPAFHVTAITHRNDAVYPATIVGIPPQEDAWIGKATERLFLSPIRMTMAAEVEDMHMPPAGVAHNLVIVRIEKRYPGQGMKVLSTLFGAGQMMFSKFIVVVSGDTDIRNLDSMMKVFERNVRFGEDIMFIKGPLDVLDHSSGQFSFGGKMGIDATEKLPEEIKTEEIEAGFASYNALEFTGTKLKSEYPNIVKEALPIRDGVIAVWLYATRKASETGIIKDYFTALAAEAKERYIAILLEEGVSLVDLNTILWQVTGNTDPVRDIKTGSVIIIDAGFKLPERDGAAREWPNVVVSDIVTITKVDGRWAELTGMEFVPSPSLSFLDLNMGEGASASKLTR
ncbi:MAG: menaquinone biosynthesis decarboxylase [Bacteroidales bacterium]